MILIAWTTWTEGGETNDLTPATGRSLYIAVAHCSSSFPNDIRFLRLLRENPAAMLLQCTRYIIHKYIYMLWSYNRYRRYRLSRRGNSGVRHRGVVSLDVTITIILIAPFRVCIYLFIFSLIFFRLRLRSPTADYRYYHYIVINVLCALYVIISCTQRTVHSAKTVGYQI